jgi:hypothetical protein
MISDTQQATRGRNPSLDFIGARGNSSSFSNADSALELYGNTLHGGRDIAQNFNQGHKMATLSAALGGAGLSAQNFTGISNRQTQLNLTKFDQKNKNTLHNMELASSGAQMLGAKFQSMSSSKQAADAQYAANKAVDPQFAGAKPDDLFSWNNFTGQM